MTIPQQAAYLLQQLNHAGYEAFVVGGCVRDALLGRPAQDWDICTSALPQQTMTVFADHKLVTDGIAHGTVGVVLDGTLYEITTYRTESGYTDSRHPDAVTFVRSIGQDLARRDFTVNAMAYHPEKGLVDLFGGREDLAAGILRCVGDPEIRFGEDALRILRALRFAAVYDFTLHPDTARAVLSCRQGLTHISAERICAELSRFLCGCAAPRLMREFSPTLQTVLPLLPEEALQKAADRIENTPPKLSVRLAALLCSIPTQAEEILRSLKFSKKLIGQVCDLLNPFPDLPEKAALRLLLGRLGEDSVRDRLALERAISGDHDAFFRRTALADAILLAGDCCTVGQLAVRGEDLKQLGFSGAAIGQMLQKLLLAVVTDQIANEKDALLHLAQKGKEETE